MVVHSGPCAGLGTCQGGGANKGTMLPASSIDTHAGANYTDQRHNVHEHSQSSLSIYQISTTELSTQASAGTACPAASPAFAAAPGSQAGSAPPSAGCGSTALLAQQHHPRALLPVQQDKGNHTEYPVSAKTN